MQHETSLFHLLHHVPAPSCQNQHQGERIFLWETDTCFLSVFSLCVCHLHHQSRSEGLFLHSASGSRHDWWLIGPASKKLWTPCLSSSHRGEKKETKIHVASNLRKCWPLNILGACSHLSATRLSIFNGAIQPQQPRIPLEIQEGHGLIAFMQNFPNSLCTSFQLILPSSAQWAAKVDFSNSDAAVFYFGFRVLCQHHHLCACLYFCSDEQYC